MRKCKRILSILLVCILCFSSFQVNVSATETTDSDVQERLQLAQELGVEDWVDNEGYLIESFYEGKSDYELEQMGVSPLVRSLTDDELAAKLYRLQNGMSSRTVTAYQKVSDGVNTVGYFEVDGHLAFCIQHSASTPAANSPTSTPVESSNDNLRKVLYYGNGGPGDLGYNYIYTSLCASRANGYTSGCMGTTTTNIYNNIIAQASPPSGFHVYTVKTNGGSTQDLAYWTIQEVNGNLKIQKSSANTSITSNNSCYSLAGAVYGVYSNSNCTTQVGTLTTTADGSSNTLTLAAGTYYVKELSAPKGYALDTRVHSVTVTSGNTATLKVTDLPQSDPVWVLLGKVDAETNKNKPQGSASLEGAHFTVKYYDVQMSTDPAISGYTPVRTWVLATDEDGYCELRDSYKVSGDEFYYEPKGVPTLPIGTITIQETKAPEGYLLNNEVYVQNITPVGGTETVFTYNQPVIPETTLDLDIVKVDANTDATIPGVTFKHTLPDGTTEEVKTDSEGKAAFKGLTYGTHTVEEVSVPDGYTKNPGKVTFKVATDNTVTLTSNTSASATGSMTFSVQSDGCPLLKVEDVLAPYSLTVHKQNENGKVLEGAEFTLYSDVVCKTVVGTATSDAKGLLTFSDLTVGTEYYLKETKAPQGYRIPINSDGSDIVYKIKTVSNPVKGTFEYYVNDEKHTDTTGDYAVTGTVAERVVNLKVVNYTGIKMPDTGTNTTILLFILETGFMLFAYAFMQEKKGRKIDYEKL